MERKIEVRVVDSQGSHMRVGGLTLPVHKIFQANNEVIKETQINDGKKIIIEEVNTLPYHRIQEEIVRAATRLFEQRFGAIKKFNHDHVRIGKDKRIAYDVFLDHFSEVMDSRAENTVEPHPEPVEPVFKQQYRQSLYECMHAYFKNYGIDIQCIYNDKENKYLEIADEVDVRYESLHQLLYEWDSLHTIEQEIFRKNIEHFLKTLLLFFEDTGYFPYLGEDITELQHASTIIIDNEKKVRLIAYKRPYKIPSSIMHGMTHENESILTYEPLSIRADIKQKLYNDPVLDGNYNVQRLKKMECLDPVFHSIGEICYFLNIHI